ncbi:MAG: hypothetical protein U0452_14490 [Anaerolineae bacterium]
MISRSSTPNTARRNGGCACGCGCLSLLALAVAVTLAGVLFTWPRLPNLAAQAVGFQERGAVAQVFEAITPVPAPVLANLAPAGPVTFTVPSMGSGTLTGTEGVALQIGSDPLGGAAAGQITLTENDLVALCARYADVCLSDPRFQNPRVDLRRGGAVVTADVTLPELGGITQSVGIVVSVDSTGRELRVQGIDLGGTLYAVPNNDIGNLVRNAEAQLNSVLAQLVVDTSAGRLALDRITMDDSTLTVTLR